MKKVYMIGNAHLDPVWLWDYREGFAEIKATFQSALDRLDEDSEFIFTSSSAAYYEWIEKNNPAMFEEIKKKISEGRWRIMGGSWIQPDCNLPSGESLVRQNLVGQNYFMEKFGIRCKIGYNVDSFGHNIILPQILKKTGMDSYVFMRPMPNEKMIPDHIFNYTSRDGSSVKAFRILYEYLSSSEDIEFHINRCFDQVGNNDSIMCFYGVGNHGGGPTKENLRTIHRLQEEQTEMEVLFSDPLTFFENNDKKELVTVMDELQYHAVGCYSALSKVKEANKKSEVKLFQAEAITTLIQIKNEEISYPKDELLRAWKNILFNQFHDILPGTSIKSAYKYVNDQYGEANSIAERIMNQAIQQLTWDINIDKKEGSTPIVAINLSQYNKVQPLEAEVPLKVGNYSLKDYDGNEIPMQIIRSEAAVDRKIHPRGRIVFTDSIPAFGYKLYYLTPDDNEVLEDSKINKHLSIENKRLKAIFDEHNGKIIQLIDKKTGLNQIVDNGIALKIFEDKTDTWSHGTKSLGTNEKELEFLGFSSNESGLVKNSLIVKYKYNNSLFHIEYSLYENIPYLYGNLKYFYNEPQTLVRLEVPVNVDFPKITADMTFGTIERETSGDESFYHKFVDLEGLHKQSLETSGISIATDGRYSYSAKKNILSIILLRNAYYANHEPMGYSNELFSGLDEGSGEVRFTIYPHNEAFVKSEALAIATQFNNPAFIQTETYHYGTKKPEDSFFSVDSDNLYVSAIKISEDTKGIIIRIAEYNGINKEATIKLFNESYFVSFKPFEVKTLKIDIQNWKMKEVTMLEEDYE